MDLIGPSACQDYSRIPSSESFGKQGGGCANLGLTAPNRIANCTAICKIFGHLFGVDTSKTVGALSCAQCNLLSTATHVSLIVCIRRNADFSPQQTRATTLASAKSRGVFCRK